MGHEDSDVASTRPLRHDESSRNATKHGLQTVPESSQKQEDKVNSVYHEPQMNPQLRNEHAMKSHICRINRGVRQVESVKVPEFVMDFCYLLQDDQAWATTLVMVDVAAQNPLCAAISTKSDENAYLSAMCAVFVKRMAYTKAVLKVDPEPALRLLADKIAVRASADGIQLKVETAPRFISQLHWCSWASTRRCGTSDSMLASRVGNTTLDRSDTRHGRVAVVGETRWMV